MIDWSKMKTAEQQAAETAPAAAVTCTRRQGLLWLFDNFGIEERDLQARIDAITRDDPEEERKARYRAGIDFNAGNWNSENETVIAFAAPLGLDTPQKRAAAFSAAVVAYP